jgi:hypothetical protein
LRKALAIALASSIKVRTIFVGVTLLSYQVRGNRHDPLYWHDLAIAGFIPR